MICSICQSEMLEPVQGLFALPTVTSDCRPWIHGKSVEICSGCGVMHRVIEPAYKKVYNTIYDDYKSYPEPSGRTEKILRFIKDKILEPKSILDVGCGQGEGIKILQEQFPDAAVFGYEPTIHDKRPNGRFDLITLFHVLEHVDDLQEMLAYIKSSLTSKGYVLIQVPYTELWPFDLILADHIWHFSGKALIHLFTGNGLHVTGVGNDVIRKEITLLARPIDKKIMPPLIGRSPQPEIDWILNFKKKLDGIDKAVAVYGTGPAAAWAGSILGHHVKYHIDDDKNRQDLFNGYIVTSPIACKLPVVAPFPDWQLPDIKAKHPTLKFIC